jgi:hypothetical protein
MKLLSSVFGGMGLAVVTSMLTLSACGGDNSTVIASTGGASSAGGSSSAGGGGAVGGGGTTGGTTSTSTSAGPVKVNENALMTDFSEVPDGTVANLANPKFSWGTNGLTGGTFTYQQNDPDAPTGTVTGGALHITAALAASEYAGFGFYFGPNSGSDASAYAGFKFDISGTMPGIQLDIQVQMSPDYPISSNKGTCDFASQGYDDTTKWNYCTNPHVHFENVPGVADLSTTAQTVTVPWSVLVGGTPVDAIDPTQLLGIQLQFNCDTTASNVDITVDNLTFYK